MRQRTPYGVPVSAELRGELMFRRQLNPGRVLTLTYGDSQVLCDTRPQRSTFNRFGQQGIQKKMLLCHESYTSIA